MSRRIVAVAETDYEATVNSALGERADIVMIYCQDLPVRADSGGGRVGRNRERGPEMDDRVVRWTHVGSDDGDGTA